MENKEVSKAIASFEVIKQLQIESRQHFDRNSLDEQISSVEVETSLKICESVLNEKDLDGEEREEQREELKIEKERQNVQEQTETVHRRQKLSNRSSSQKFSKNTAHRSPYNQPLKHHQSQDDHNHQFRQFQILTKKQKTNLLILQSQIREILKLSQMTKYAEEQKTLKANIMKLHEQIRKIRLGNSHSQNKQNQQSLQASSQPKSANKKYKLESLDQKVKQEKMKISVLETKLVLLTNYLTVSQKKCSKQFSSLQLQDFQNLSNRNNLEPNSFACTNNQEYRQILNQRISNLQQMIRNTNAQNEMSSSLLVHDRICLKKQLAIVNTCILKIEKQNRKYLRIINNNHTSHSNGIRRVKSLKIDNSKNPKLHIRKSSNMGNNNSNKSYTKNKKNKLLSDAEGEDFHNNVQNIEDNYRLSDMLIVQSRRLNNQSNGNARSFSLKTVSKFNGNQKSLQPCRSNKTLRRKAMKVEEKEKECKQNRKEKVSKNVGANNKSTSNYMKNSKSQIGNNKLSKQEKVLDKQEQLKIRLEYFDNCQEVMCNEQ